MFAVHRLLFAVSCPSNAASPNVGLKMTAEAVGAGIAHRESRDPNLRYGVLDPACFKEDGGPSIAERINKGLFALLMSGATPACRGRSCECPGYAAYRSPRQVIRGSLKTEAANAVSAQAQLNQNPCFLPPHLIHQRRTHRQLPRRPARKPRLWMKLFPALRTLEKLE